MSKLYITDFGARPGDLCTASIQKALDASTAAGGETVVVPRGTFYTGSLNLGTSSLELEKGAVLMGSANIDDYAPIGYDHAEMGNVRSLIYAVEAEGIRVYGEGTIDFNGDSFFTPGDFVVSPSKVPMTQEQIESPPFGSRRPNQR